ncbi:MAG: helix-turn-helix transcriptional regulator [Thioploca sp.]|nr:helix-turn-helix transcriptional regulator [Thioploca sp.]
MKLHERIRLMRTANGWSQEEIAEKLHMSLNAYGCIERGETRPNLNRLEQIAQILGVKLEELVSDRNILNFGIDSSNFNNWYNTSPSEQLIELQHELEKSRLLLEQKDKEIEYLKQQNVDLRTMVNLLKPEDKLS